MHRHGHADLLPGGKPLERLDITHDAAGDCAMTQRFCSEVLRDRKPAVAAMWLTDPDHATHGVPLGSPEHMAALAGVDRCAREVMATVEELRRGGEDILFLVGSDHGHETIGAGVSIEAWMAERGLGELLAAGDVAVAGQGTAALLYATEKGRPDLLGVLDVDLLTKNAPRAGIELAPIVSRPSETFFRMLRHQACLELVDRFKVREAERQAAARYLKALVSVGVLTDQAIGKEKLFVHPKLMNLLTRDTNAFMGY